MKKTKMKKILYILIIAILFGSLGLGNFVNTVAAQAVPSNTSTSNTSQSNSSSWSWVDPTTWDWSAISKFNTTMTVSPLAAVGYLTYKTAIEKKSPPVKSCFNSVDPTTFFGFDMEGCVAEASRIILWMASWFLWVAGWFFNATIVYSLNMGEFFKHVPIVDMGWKILRDVANLCFIFILLYIAINTILQTKSTDTKRLLIRVVIVAIVLNFSLFFAKVIIDSSNILALQFYEKMSSVDNSNEDSRSSFDKGISQTFIKHLGIENVYRAGGSGEEQPIPTGKNTILIMLGGVVLIIVTAFVFMAGAIMFIIRTVTLIFLLILSPLAFLAMILPQTEGHWKKWIGYLLNQSFFAPIYMMMMYLVIAILSTGQFRSPQGAKINLASFLSGNADSVGTLYVFVVLIALMLGALYIAKSLGAVGGDFARNVAGKVTFGAGGWLGRQTAGRLAQRVSKSDFVGNMRNATGFKAPLRSIAGMVDKGATGSFDIRGSAIGAAAGGAVGGLGKAGGEGGMRKMKDDDNKRRAELAKIALMSGKKEELKTALKMSDGDPRKVAAVQAAINKFSDSEYADLDSATLSNPVVVQNSRHSQILAATDAKNEKLNESQKDVIKKARRAELENSLSSTPQPFNGQPARTVEKVLDDMDDKEKANLPIELLKNPEVFRHLGKGVQDKISDRADLTPTQQKEITAARGTALSNAATATSSPQTDALIKNIMKGMSAKGLIKLHEDSGNTLLQKPEIAKYITGAQLKDMAEIGTIQNPGVIGAEIVRLGTGAVAHQYMAKPSNNIQWS